MLHGIPFADVNPSDMLVGEGCLCVSGLGYHLGLMKARAGFWPWVIRDQRHRRVLGLGDAIGRRSSVLPTSHGQQRGTDMTRTFLLAATLFTLVSGSAYADLIPDDVYACNNLSTGSSCSNGTGVCQDSTCSRLDYAHWDRDASAAPPSTSYSCKKCVPKSAGTGTGVATTTAASTGTGVATTMAASTGTGVTTTTVESTGTGVTTTTAASTGTGVTTTTAASTGTGLTTTTVASTGTGTTTVTTPEKQEESKDSSGCSVSGARVIAPWLLAGIFAACVSLLRRRPRR